MPQSTTPPDGPNSNVYDDWNNSLAGQRWQIWSQYSDAVDELHARWVKNDRRAAYVYLAHMIMTDEEYDPRVTRVKIGITKNIKAREAELNRFPVRMPVKVYIARSFFADDARAVESFLHRMLARHRMEGEWFLLPHDVEMPLYGIWYAEISSGTVMFQDIEGKLVTYAELVDGWNHEQEQSRARWRERQSRQPE